MLTSEKDLLRDTLQFDVLKKSQQVYATQFTGTQGMDTPISSSIANEKKNPRSTYINFLFMSVYAQYLIGVFYSSF